MYFSACLDWWDDCYEGLSGTVNSEVSLPVGGSTAGRKRQSAGRKSGPPGAAKSVRLHRGPQQSCGEEAPAAANAAGAAPGGDLQVSSLGLKEGGMVKGLRALLSTSSELGVAFRLEAAKDDYRIRCEELEKEMLELRGQNEDLTSLADEAQSLKDEMDILR